MTLYPAASHRRVITSIIPSVLWAAQYRRRLPVSPKEGWTVHPAASHRLLFTLIIPSAFAFWAAQVQWFSRAAFCRLA
jgi:hypothetical protein